MDEEEDEDDYILIPVFEDVRESSLMRALTDDEKKNFTSKRKPQRDPFAGKHRQRSRDCTGRKGDYAGRSRQSRCAGAG